MQAKTEQDIKLLKNILVSNNEHVYSTLQHNVLLLLSYSLLFLCVVQWNLSKQEKWHTHTYMYTQHNTTQHNTTQHNTTQHNWTNLLSNLFVLFVCLFCLFTCPWYSPASCTVCSILPSNSYVLLMYLFHSFVSVSSGILKMSFITDTISAAKKSKRTQLFPALHVIILVYILLHKIRMHLCLETFKEPNFWLILKQRWTLKFCYLNLSWTHRTVYFKQQLTGSELLQRYISWNLLWFQTQWK